MRPKAYLGLDIGGTGAKAGIVDPEGRLLALAHRGYQPIATPEGHIEIPVEQIYEAAREAAATVIRQSGAEILALSISSQGQTFVSLDDRDEPLHPAIIWYDSRATEQADQLQKAVQAANLRGPFPLVQTIASAPKIMWLRERHPARMAQARRFLLLPEYFSYRLTGRAATDPITASSTALYAHGSPDYCAAALDAAKIRKEQLAEILPAGTLIGRVRPQSAVAWQLSPETQVVTGNNDQFVATLGAGNCRPGMLTVMTGTCLALVALTNKLPDPLPTGLFGGHFPIPPYDYALTYSKTAGVVLDWFKRELGGASLHEMDGLAAEVPAGSHGAVMLPYFDGMFSPVPNLAARGAFMNLQLHHTRADLYRAALEALGYTFRENLELMEHHGLVMNTVRAMGGGAKSNFWLQMKADIAGRAIEKPQVTETAVLGAAMFAAVGHGAFRSLAEGSEAFAKVERVFEPNAQNHARYEGLYKNYQALYRHVYRFAGNS
jgi:xylulokinase